MRSLSIAALTALALTAACRDIPRETPTEAQPEAAAAAADRSAAQADASSLCVAYREQLAEAHAAAARAPGDESLQETVATFQAVISDACP